MFQLLQRKDIENEEKLARLLIGGDPGSGGYRVLKSRVRDRLINTILSLDVKHLGRAERHTGEQECMRLLRCSRLLISLGMRDAGIYFARKALRLARNYELSLLHLMCLKILRYHFSYIGKRTTFNRYTREVERLTEVINAELQLDNYLQSMRIEFARSISAGAEVRETSMRYALEARSLLNRVQSFDINFNAYRLIAIAHQANGDYDTTIEICTEALADLDKRAARFDNDVIRQEFELKRMVCLMGLRRYDEGLKCGARCLELMGDRRANFLLIYEPILLMHMHLGDYNTALEIYRKVVNDRRFNMAIEAHRMRWYIFEAYLHMCAEFGWVKAPRSWTRERFDTEQFRRKVQPLVRDRGGLNVAILVVELLFYIRRFEETDKLDVLSETVLQFIGRRLRDSSQRRSKIFLRMLVSISSCSFDYEQIKRKNRRRFSDLQAAQQEVDGATAGMDALEVIPYERLWQGILTFIRTAGRV